MANYDVPAIAMQECTFALQDNATLSPFDKGKAFNLSQVNDPAWKVTIKTIPLTRQKRQVWSAFKNSLRGGLNRARGFDVSHFAPLNYIGALSPSQIANGWNGTSSVSSVGLSGSLGLTGLPSGYVAKAGDRIGLEQNGRYGYYEVLFDAIANGGGTVSVTVAPLLHTTYFTAAATARLWQPKALFVIDWKAFDLTATSEMMPVTMTGYQVLI